MLDIMMVQWGGNGLYVGPRSPLLGPVLGNLNPGHRYQQGYQIGVEEGEKILNGLSDGETIKVITHSMGAAYAKGLVQGMIDVGVNPSLFAFEADFAPFQPTSQKAVGGVDTYQYSHSKDLIAGNNRMQEAHFMNTSNDTNQGHSIDDFWNQVANLPTGVYGVEDGEIMPKAH